MNSARDEQTIEDRDSRLSRLLDQLIQAPDEAGDLLQAHPDLAGELQELWGVARFAQAMGTTESGDPVPLNRTLSIGQRFGDYQILEQIGAGGMGVVYRARDTRLGRVVALKMLLKGAHSSPVDIARLRSEANILAKLDHPNLIPVHEVGEVEGQSFFAMKYISGRTLSARLAEGPLDAREAVSILIPVCRAVAQAHTQGILHRDLKPSNILLDPQGIPHVSDFGLAKELPRNRQVSLTNKEPSPQSLTITGAMLGTPSYMAPEQAAGVRGELSPATDVYGLGAILYQMLTGRPPFQAASPFDILMLVLEQDPPLPRLLNPRVDRDLEMIALKCLQKPQELRYAAPLELANDLEAWSNNLPISARSLNLSQILSRLLRETHHASILENWGLLWMWHSLVLLVICVLTNLFKLSGMEGHTPYVCLWTIGMGTWASLFWALRRRGGPITFVERQIAHVWTGSVIASVMLLPVEILLGLPVIQLSPVLALISAMVFLVKAGILSGAFYLQAIALFLTSPIMAWIPRYGVTIFGIVSAICFFVPGYKYYRQREECRLDEANS